MATTDLNENTKGPATGAGDIRPASERFTEQASAMPPTAATHARYLCKRLQGRFPGGRLIVGLWNAQGDLAKARARIGCEGAVRVVATLAQAHEQIQVILQPLLVRRESPAQPEVR